MKKIFTIRIIVLSVLLSIGLYYEKSSSIRGLILFSSAAFLLLSPIIEALVKKLWERPWERISEYTFMIQIILAFILNYYSRFNINVIFISLYIIIIMESFFFKDKKGILICGLFSMIFLSCNFIFIFPYGINYELISQMFFIEIVLLLFTFTLFLLKSYLEEKAKVIKLTKLAERSELAESIHDNIGHQLTGLIMMMEMIKMTNKNLGVSNEKGDIMMDDATESARSILRSLRKLVEDLNEKNKEEMSYDYINEKIKEFSGRTGIKIDFTCNLPFDSISMRIRNIIYRTVIEAITNTARHSASKKVDIGLSLLEKDSLSLEISDYGNFSGEIKEGNGIRFMKERVELSGGNFSCSGDSRGFKISIILEGIYDD